MYSIYFILYETKENKNIFNGNAYIKAFYLTIVKMRGLDNNILLQSNNFEYFTVISMERYLWTQSTALEMRYYYINYYNSSKKETVIWESIDIFQ